MSISDRDFALLQDEVKCLRKKFGTFLSTNGGYVNGPVEIPDSSVYPNETMENCGCAHVVVAPSTLHFCAKDGEPDDVPLGDFSEYAPVGGYFVFSAMDGVYFRGPSDSDWASRNTGLTDITLEHGALDPWWYKKNTPNPDGVILWRVGNSKVLRSPNAGKSTWDSRTPTAPTGVSISNIKFVQVHGDFFRRDKVYLLASTTVAPYRTWLVYSTDDGFDWTWLELTDYNGVSSRLPIWMTISGTTGSLIWLTTWGDGTLRLLKINNDEVITVSAEYSLGNATQWEMENKYYTASPICALDSESEVWIYGRMNNPQSLGLTHVIKAVDSGSSFSSVKSDLGTDWVGSMRVGLAAGSSRNVYGVSNVRDQGTADLIWGVNTFQFSEEVS